mgnify:CR=1 FL=1
MLTSSAAIQTFMKAEWQCTGAAGFFDLDEQKTRERDIDAYYGIGKDMGGGRSTSVLLYHTAVEAKNTAKPWVVFKVGSMPWYKVYDSQHLVFSQSLPFQERDLNTVLSKNTIAEKENWVATSIHQSFKNPAAPSRWYSACVTACKAAEHLLCKYEPNPDAPPYHRPFQGGSMIMFVVIRPVVVLDGILLAAEVNEGSEIIISEIEWAALNFSFETEKYTRRNYRVDLVTLNKLSDYIQLSELRFNAIHDEMLRKIGIAS